MNCPAGTRPLRSKDLPVDSLGCVLSSRRQPDYEPKIHLQSTAERDPPTNQPKSREEDLRISPNLRPLSFGLRILVTVALAAHVLNYGSPLVAQSEVDQEIQELERALEEIKARARAGENVKARIQALRDELDSLEQQMADDDSDLQQQGEEPVETDETEGPRTRPRSLPSRNSPTVQMRPLSSRSQREAMSSCWRARGVTTPTSTQTS